MKGFTLIELIIVIILISILAGLGIGLLSGTDGFAPRVAMDQLLNSLRLSQRLALLKQSSSELLDVTLSQTSDSWNVSVNFDGAELNSFDIDRNRVSMSGSTSDFASSCDALPLITFPMTFYLDGYGNHVSAARVQQNTNQRLCFIGDDSVELCIGPSGYAYAGACEP